MASVNADHSEYGPAGVSSAPSLVLALLPTLTAPPAVQRPMGFSQPCELQPALPTPLSPHPHTPGHRRPGALSHSP